MKTLATFLLITLPAMIFAQHQPIDLFVGTYTNNGKSKGIYVYAFDPATGSATLKSTTESGNPSFLAVSADRKYVYAANENVDGKGAVSAYAYDGATGKLTLLNEQLTQGDAPCHVATDSRGTHVIASNYMGGSISVFPIKPDGSLGPIKQFIQHTGSGPDKSRQEAPHVHSAFFTPDEKRVYIQDLGTDKVHIYDFQPASADKPLVPSVQPFAQSAPGGGPRHLAQSADGSFAYLVQEMTGKVMVYRQQNGQLEPIQEVEMNEDGFAGKNGAADIKLSPDGKFLYASNRGDANTLAIYRVNATDGKLTKVGNQSVLGRGPRNFNITPDGRYLLVANQNTDEVVVFTRDADTGLLRDTGNRIAVGSPVCLVF
ncbi:lactonase family protein [Parapedobacter koreensis]|uniref:6-phosphogluconolactonase n=1 Tax=Parapedobacter koreensis TaxID=332977 RepID=A0A1H7SBB8_9SPHI|nr:lactonase family protein [Parapedobacter koreensis]SEL69910.1 6-phosphogluconolactonase [Parapedobacter koreensis]